MPRKVTKLVQGDQGSEWAVDLTDKETGLPIDLTNATGAVMYFRANGTTTVLMTVNMVIESPATAGRLSLSWPALAYPQGHYEGEIEISLTGGGKITVYDLFPFYLREDVGP